MVLRKSRPAGGRHGGAKYEGKSLILALGLLCLTLLVWSNGKFVRSTFYSPLRVERLEAIDAELAQILATDHHGAWESTSNKTTPAVDSIGHGRLGGRERRGCDSVVSAAEKPESRANSTLVIYIYNAEDAEEQQNLLFFINFAIAADDGVTYRIVVTSGGKVLVRLVPDLEGVGGGWRARAYVGVRLHWAGTLIVG